VPDAWTTWFIGCLPPAILGMVVTPILLFKLFPPEVRDASEGLQAAASSC
jgi:DASS family divalent anion:Na+ symporter